MRIQAGIFRRLPINRKLPVIVAVFVAIVICVFYLGVLRSEILSGVRAYVGGEGLWSKAEKQAVFSLTRYATSHAESDYQQYLAEIAVPEGDKQARLQLSSPSLDMDVVFRGFVQGRNSPEDVENMANLFRRFGTIGYMARAIAIWTEGDSYIDQLHALAGELHQEVTSSRPDAQRIQQLTDQIASIDARLTPLEDAFSSTLGQGARWMNRLLSLVTFLASALLLLMGIGFSAAVLKQSRNLEERYRNLIDTANDAILVMDAQTRLVLEVNSKACQLFGIPERQFVGMQESQLYSVKEDEGSRSSSPYASGTEPGRELDLRRPDGTSVPVEVSASDTAWGGRAAVLTIFRDLRDRREAAAVLRRSEERFGHFIEDLADVITVVAVDGTIIYQSPSIERVAGYQPSEMLGRNFRVFVHPQDDAPVQSAFHQVMVHSGTAAPPEFRFLRRDGSWVWLESVANNLLKDDAVGGIVVTSRDVSGRRVLEEQVRQSQKMEAVGRLAGGIAHDFNNLLMVIRGYSEILLQEENTSPAMRKGIETIVRTTESATSLTRQLLSFSRKHVFSPQVLDLNALVERMSEMLLGLLREEMEFIVKLAPHAGCISADPGQIEQVVMNLVVNARDAMPQGGRLTLETAHSTMESVGASNAVPLGDYVVLTVADTGIGMDAETQSRIFEPFFTTKSKEEGTGLGLSVVYNIVRGVGGHVRVTSEPGRGSTFQVFLPHVTQTPQPHPVAALAGGLRSGMETILVAEDQPDLRWMICHFLQDLGYSVLEAKDGGDAVALAEQYKDRIDVLLTDVVMPHNRGPEVARRLRASRPAMKVIFMSGYTEGGFASPGDLGPEATLLQKPFELDSLALKIREVLEARSRL